MINEHSITDYYNDYCYNNYYEKSKYTDKYYEAMAEKYDQDYEDKIFDEMNKEEK